MTNNSRSRWVYTGLLAAFLVATASQAQAQNAVISGRVVSEFQEPLEAAQVFIQELNIITTTNSAGNYTLTVPGERARGQAVQLRVRRIGFAPDAQQITLAAGPQTVNFTLRQDATRLSEVVVTGVTAGTEVRKLPFAVDRVSVEDIPVPALNPLTQLQGKVPGATIIGASGRPGVAPQVLLRGPMSINATGRSQGPLYILDGVLITGGLPDINPADIESVEVVKGAAASSLYGAQAGSGVIQITTKSARGAADGVRFTVRSEVGIGDIEGDFGIARNHGLVMDETRTRFCVSPAVGEPLCARTVDWNQEIMRVNNMLVGSGEATVVDAPAALVTSQFNAALPGMPQPLRQRFQTETYPMRVFNAVETGVQTRPLIQNNLDMQGRFGGTSFFASVGHVTQEGALRFMNGYNRTSARLNIDQQIGANWSVALRNMYSESENHGWGNDGGSGTSFFYLTRQPPPANMAARDTLGRLLVRTDLRASGAQNMNPLHILQATQDPTHTRRYIGGGTVRFTPVQWIDLEGNVGYDNDNTSIRYFVDRNTRSAQGGGTSAFWGGGNIDYRLFNTRALNGSLAATARRELLPDLQTRFTLRSFFQRNDADVDRHSGGTLAVPGVPNPTNITSGQTVALSQYSTVRTQGFAGGVNLEYRERYIVDALVRRDGSSLFGADSRWSTFGRVSGAWRLSEEPFWFIEPISELKLRASYGSAGGSPNFAAQFETWTVGVGGVLSTQNLGNRLLKPETIHETEFGVDLEVLNRFGLNLTYAVSESRDQILPVPLSVATGYQQQWMNAGTLRTNAFEAALNIPLLSRRDLTWNTRVVYDNSSTEITRLDVAPFNFGTPAQATGNIFRAAAGEQFGTMYGRYLLVSCAELPADFRNQCGPGRAFQHNSDGFVVWVGEGNNPGMGITNNLWQTALPGASAPWGFGLNWGTPIVLRSDVEGPGADACPDGTFAPAGCVVALGNALPDWRLGVSQTLTWRRFSLYGLLDGVFGRDVWNQGRAWALLDYMARDTDQAGLSVQEAKPVGYFWRGAQFGGIGGLYDALGANNWNVERADFLKLRELSLSYRFGQIGGFGDWQASLIGRNLFTITDYTGFDPEVGLTGGQAGSGIINAIDAFTFPNLRTFTFSIQTSF